MNLEISDIFKYAYENTNGAISSSEQYELFGKTVHHVYGEILPESLAVLLDDMKLTNENTLYDFGSGLGKVVIQAALCTEARAVGVELSKSRYERAKNAVKRILTKYPKLEPRLTPPNLEFINSDFTKVKLKPNSIIFTCSTCFNESLLEQIKQIATEAKARIYTLRALPGMRADKEFNLPMTWNNSGVPVYLYGG